MLDVLRRHAASTIIKIILGMIIISFAFFYGFNKIRKRSRGATGDVAAEVNGSEVPTSNYYFFYDQMQEKFGKDIKNPEEIKSMKRFIKQLALNQIIRRQMFANIADEAGIKITDRELAKAIRKEFTRDGEFDSYFYLHKYVPYFKNKYGLDYEYLRRQDLALDNIASELGYLDIRSMPAGDEYEYKFLVASFNPNISKDLKNKDGAIKAAKDMLSKRSALDWKNSAKKMGGKVKEIGPVTIDGRNRVLTEASDEDYKKIFSLARADSKLSEPIVIGNTAYAIMLLQRKKVEEPNAGVPFLDKWVQSENKTAKVKIFIED